MSANEPGPARRASPEAALVAEAWRACRSAPLGALLVLVLVAGVCLSVLLTSGRTASAEAAVIGRIDDAGTRSIVIRADPMSPLPAAHVDTLEAIEGVEEVVAFGPLVDARNALVPSAPSVPSRAAYGTLGGHRLMAVPDGAGDQGALASERAAAELGLLDGVGSAVTIEDHVLAVRAGLRVPDHLAFAEPLLVLPSSIDGSGAGTDPTAPVTLLVAITREPSDVAAVTSVVRGLLADSRIDGQVETSQELASIRSAVSGELGDYGRASTLAALGAGILLLSAAIATQLNGRRRMYGRRRALGASRPLVIALVLLEVGIPAITGAVAGTVAALLTLRVQGADWPPVTYLLALAVAAVVTALVAAVVPAVLAARRDPLKELRVP